VRVYEEPAPGRHERFSLPDAVPALMLRMSDVKTYYVRTERRVPGGRHVRHTPPDEQLGARPEVAGALELKARLDSQELTYTQYQVAKLALEGRAWPHAAI